MNGPEVARKRANVAAMDRPFEIRPDDVRRRFDRAADTFDTADFAHASTRDGLFDRLEGVTVDAKRIVDLGCATGAATRRLGKRFKGARIFAVDFSQAMLDRCAARQGWLSKTSVVLADATELPFDDHSIDVVFSNLLLPWIDEPSRVAAEVSRVLRKEGLFIFSTLGPDSLLELRRAWQSVDDEPHVNVFLDMHDVGDSLVRAGLRDPVLDVDRLTIRYENAERLFADLSACGARNALRHRRHTLTGRGRLAAFRRALTGGDRCDGLEVELEIVYGHCWGSGQARRDGETRIDAGTIPIRNRRS